MPAQVREKVTNEARIYDVGYSCLSLVGLATTIAVIIREDSAQPPLRCFAFRPQDAPVFAAHVDRSCSRVSLIRVFSAGRRHLPHSVRTEATRCIRVCLQHQRASLTSRQGCGAASDACADGGQTLTCLLTAWGGPYLVLRIVRNTVKAAGASGRLFLYTACRLRGSALRVKR